jgi:prepilin-type processing-associated H-X9-DG protein
VFTELPASYHNNACGLSFADGHAEVHKWLNPATMPPITCLGNGPANQQVGTTKNVDLVWLAQKTPRPSTDN